MKKRFLLAFVYAFILLISNHGQLVHKSSIFNGENGLLGLDEVSQVSITNNGKHLYTISNYAVGIYSVDNSR